MGLMAQDASRDLHILGFERQQRDNFVDRHRSSCLGICSEVRHFGKFLPTPNVMINESIRA
eukprot:995802-Pleurochrysis_carterae.AAC.2